MSFAEATQPESSEDRKVQFLGTAAEGYPDAFRNCHICNAARLLGGRPHRLRSSLLIDDELLIDFGPGPLTVSMRLNVPLHRISFGHQTHANEDHLDKLVSFARNRYWDVIEVNPNDYFCPHASLVQLNRLVDGESVPTDFHDPNVQDAF